MIEKLLSDFLIALSLAMDALAVSVSAGIACRGPAARQGLRLGAWFGTFQFLMPLIGLMLGRTLAAYIEAVAPYIAFALLAFIGARMVWDAVQPPEGQEEDMADLPAGKVCLLAVATSIDALGVGLGLGLSEGGTGLAPVLVTCAIIGAVAFALSFLGAVAGRKLGERFNRWAQGAGGLVLIGIGLKFLIQHLFF